MQGQGAPTAASGAARPWILVADHEPVARATTVRLLAAAGHRVQAVASGEEALRAACACTPVVALLEVALPGVCGYAVCRTLRSRFGDDVGIMFVSGDRTEPFDRAGGLLLGADDYLVKPFAAAELLARVTRLLRDHLRGTGDTPLTRREGQILRLVAAGRSNPQIARELVISPKTVATHLGHILGKFDVHTRAHAVAEAYRAGLLGVR